MKKLVAFIVLAGLVATFGPGLAEERAAVMIETSAALAEQGEFEEAVAELDAARRWFGWTEAGDEIAEARREVVALAARRGVRLGPITREEMEASRARAYEGTPSGADVLDDMAEQQGLETPTHREALDRTREADRSPPPVTSGQINPAMMDERGNPRRPPR